jgi:type I restriction enzyme S subunit
MELINKNQVPEGYKKTEIGVIPEDWDVVSITKATSAIFLGLTAKVDYVNSGGIPLIRATDIASGRLKFSDARSISVRQHKQLTRYRRPKKEDVLVSKSGSLGVCAIVDVDRDFSIYESIIVIQSNSLLNSNFLLWLVRDERTQIRIIGEKVGSTVGHLNLEMFRKLLIPLPPLPEQKAIAQTLSDVDALIAALDKLIAKKRNIKTATMQQLLTGKTRLPGFGEGKGYKKTEVGVIPEDWEVKKLGDVIKILGGYGFSSRFGSNTGIKWLKISNVGIEKINWDNITYLPVYFRTKFKDYILQPKDVVIALTRPIIGNKLKIAQLTTEDTPALLNQRVAKLLPIQNTQTAFIYYVMQHLYFIISMTIAMAGTDPPNIGNTALEKILIAVPCLAEEQKAIAQVLSDIDTEITALEKRRAKTQAIKQGMMQELLIGRTRLI